ncbi:EAL domain-containing protein [Sphingomonas sp. PL-96]|uniref:bifunctional diguanylate cyclase/phosphodiesterase n=1 Tax=Sphingomonas sp. PL-96 TaxID=2887201 RepID=UPI001E3B1EDA|nr:EAL domain-containing protein [Sphingomonas sp. PL-96]MCC2977615.1 EAL domain-containing protein [Sphingomonas sp. PL-96]
MFDVYQCIWHDHDVRLVALAALICVVAAAATVLFLRQARDAGDGARTRWLVASGAVSGFAVWATHFTAMMGYDPGVVIGYAIVPSILSLAVAIGATTLGFAIALHVRSLWARILGGMITGAGVAAMHYLGMHALQMGADFRWSAGMVAASVLLAILPAPVALSLAIDGRGRASGMAAAALIVLGVLVLHFTGMAGLTLLPHPGELPEDLLLSSPQMGLAVAIVALGLLALSIMAVLSHTRLRAAVDASEREFKILVEGITDCAIYMLSSDGHVASWNAGAQRLKGYTRDEAMGLELATFYSPEDRAAGVPERGIETARREGKFKAEGWRYRKDGSRFWAHVTIESVYDETGAFHGFAKITRDMTLFKEHQSNLDAALSNMHQGLCLFGPDERLILSNDRVGTIFGVTHAECPPGTLFSDVFRIALGKHLGDACTPEIVREAVDRHRAIITGGDGGTVIVPFSPEITLSVTHRPTAEGGWVTTFDDITERRQAQQRIEHMALHDALTGLPNRANYTERLDVALAAAGRTDTHVAVIGIDLDRFKEVNDLHGHAAGDAVLRLLAERLTDMLEDSEVVARFGGDEFAAFKPFADQADVTDFVSRLETCLTIPAVIDDLTVHLGASLGIALFPADGRTREQVVNNADLAMYRAKTTVGRHICYYEPGMDEAARVRRTIANDLREAIARDELSLVYQIQKTVPTEEAVGFEALLRWQHPRDGWISPAHFIPIAEESGEIIRLGEWVLRRACAEAARWPQPLRVAVNLSPVQLMHVDLVQVVTSALLESGLPAHRLELEVTETAFIADKARALHVLRQIKELGVSIAIDDFGTGYSSLDTLNSFPFDKIKIDRSFLLNSDTNHQARAIIRAVLALGHSLDVPVLAEGLETDAQLRLLRDEGCDEAQGFLWGRPMPLPEPVPE